MPNPVRQLIPSQRMPIPLPVSSRHIPLCMNRTDHRRCCGPHGRFPRRSFHRACPKLGSIAISAALDSAGVAPEQVDEVFMGNVLQAGLGQAPARQAAIGAGIPNTVPCTTVNKVCSSGMKALHLAANAIAVGDIEVAVAGGMENMSQVPHYLQGRQGVKLGNLGVDGIVLDGLTDVYHNHHMGLCTELCAGRLQP